MIKPCYLNIPKVETVRTWSANSIRQLCIDHDYYTRGTNADYTELLQFVDDCADAPTIENVYAAAFDIALHSNFAADLATATAEIISWIYTSAINTLAILDRSSLED